MGHAAPNAVGDGTFVDIGAMSVHSAGAYAPMGGSARSGATERDRVDPNTLERAEAAYRQGRHADAAALLAPSASAANPDPAVLRVLGLCRLRLGDAAGALGLLRRALSAAPRDPWAVLHCGIGLQAVGRYDEAAELFARACALLPYDPAPAINHASALQALGRHEAAVAAAEDAVRRAPRMAAAHYTLGMARLASGAFAQAEGSFATSTRLQPGFVDAWLNLGVARYRRHEIAGAIAALRQACTAAPGHRGALGNLAALLRLNGEGELAEAILRQRLLADPDAPELRVNLAAIVLLEDRSAEALELLDGPAPSDAALRQHWHLQRAMAFLQLRRADEARLELDRLGAVDAALAPLLDWRRVALAMLDGDPAQARLSAQAMEDGLRRGDDRVMPEHQIMGCYDLAKFWSAQGAPARAFAWWEQGHRLLRRSQPFDRDAFTAFVNASIAHLDAARFSGSVASNADATPVFIVGMPRSGTTLLESILAPHRDVFAAGERGALFDAARALAGGVDPEDMAAVGRYGALDTNALDRAAQAYLADLHALAPSAGRIVDKMPGNWRFCGLIRLMLPRARIIHCERDPRDIGLSIFTFRFHGLHPYAHDLADLGWYIAQQTRLMAHWKAALPGSVLTVRLADWVADFLGTLARVLAFLDLPDDPACARFHEHERRVRTVSRAQVREGVNAKGIDRWRAYEAQLAPLIGELQAAGLIPPA